MSAGDFWTQAEWSQWSNDLADLIPEDDVALYANPEGAQESIVLACLRAYVTERAADVGTGSTRLTAADRAVLADSALLDLHADSHIVADLVEKVECILAAHLDGGAA